ncbi:uncharacterized protein LOC142937750 [Anarhichas minor]|uniref:uncharacterized protein LOC142937750 n=1 Tax=Anarhichas minor TaxID=65739 RepID=UPI003F73D686
MSRPRSRSPRYRRFPWEEPDFDPHKVVAELDGNPSQRSHRSREDPEEHWNYVREDMHPEAPRRTSPFPDDRHFGHQRHPNQEEFYRQRPSPRHSVTSFDEDRRLSPLHDDGGGGGGGGRRRGGFRELFQRYENRERFLQSPPRLAREKLPLTPRPHPDHQQREPGISSRREEQGRGRGRFRDLSPSGRSEDQRGGAGRERGRKPAQGPYRDRRREDSHQERNPTFKRQRREMDDATHLGYRNEEDFGVDSPRGRFGGDTRHSGPLVVEHDHGIADSKEPPRWEQFDDRRDLDPDFDRQRSPRQVSSSQERFRTPDSRLDDREDARGRQDNWRDPNYHETRRNPAPQERPNPVRYGNREGPVNHRGNGGSQPARGQFSRGQGGRTGPPRTQPRVQPSSQGYQDLPHEEQRPGYRPFRGDVNEDPVDAEPDWPEEERHLQRNILDPKMPRQRQRGWSDQKPNNMAVVTEETLTIKVDMSRPVNNNSSLCYSSDRQLSLDLVNVGRQRLDFLPMLEHSGTYRESAAHTGAFAQEIIMLVHHVKEQYFRDDGVSLSERFSTPQTGGYSEDESEELTLDERFSSNRGFSLNINSLLDDDDDEPLFSRLGVLQPVRGPGDLRHDLERRRQERLEGVKVTISGSSMSQRPPGPSSEPGFEYSDQDEMSQTEDEGFSSWSEEQSRRREGLAGPRRGAPYAAQRRNTRPVNPIRPMRRPNNHNNPEGPNW